MKQATFIAAGRAFARAFAATAIEQAFKGLLDPMLLPSRLLRCFKRGFKQIIEGEHQIQADFRTLVAQLTEL